MLNQWVIRCTGDPPGRPCNGFGTLRQGHWTLKPLYSRFILYAVIEEAVVNAAHHRSYEEREPIEVRITHDELVIVSFPSPDRSIRLEDLQAGGPSVAATAIGASASSWKSLI